MSNNTAAKTAREFLECAVELISDPKKWTKGAYAKNKFGQMTVVSEGCTFCSIGAIMACSPKPYQPTYDVEQRRVAENLLAEVITGVEHGGPFGRDRVVTFNDDPSRKHSEVIGAFHRAIELAKKKEKNGV